MLLSTHNTAEVAALCQRVAVMREGRIRFLGTPRDLVAIADGRVWESEHDEAGSAAQLDDRRGPLPPRRRAAAGAQVVPPTLDDGYLLVAANERRTP